MRVRAFVLLVLVVCLGGCEEPGIPEGIDLPRIGTLGLAPKAAEAIVVNVTGDGRITVDGKGPFGLVGLRNELQLRTADPTTREPDRASKLYLVVNADAALPWGVSQWIMQVAADPRVGIYKVFFGARPREGDAAGAIGWQLPRDRGLTGGFVGDTASLAIKLFARPDRQASDPEALFPLIDVAMETMGGPENARYEIKTPPPHGQAVPTGFMLQVVDVLARAGVRRLTFEGAAPPLRVVRPGEAESGEAALLLEMVAEIRKRKAIPYISVAGRVLVRRSADEPARPAAGRLDRLYGVGVGADEDGHFLEPTYVEEEIFEEEILEEEMIEEEAIEEEPLEEDAPFEEPPMTSGIGGGATAGFRGRAERRKSGESERRRAAVNDALRWLAAHQAPSGAFEAAGFRNWCDGKAVPDGPEGTGKQVYDVGTTGLAVLAFLGAGYTPRGQHPHARTVAEGLAYLRGVQDLEGCFGPRTTEQYIYNHAITALAMVEAYGMTRSRLFESSAQRGLDFLAITRNPYFAWRYGVKPGDNDTSVTGWAASTIHAAKLVNEEFRREGKAAPFTLDEGAFEGVAAWLDRMTDPDYGRTGYIQRGGAPPRPQELIDRFPGDKSESMTSMGILLRVMMGEKPRTSPIIREGQALVLRTLPTWNPNDGSLDMYAWYCGSLAMFQVGGRPWDKWRHALTKALLPHQRKDGEPCGYRGSWDPIGPWGADGGRVYATALMTLCLETPYRYPRLVR